MPGGIKEFEEDLIEEKNFHGDFDNISSIDELYKKAKGYGYDFTLEDLQNSEVLDTVLECASGGIIGNGPPNNYQNKDLGYTNDDGKIKY